MLRLFQYEPKYGLPNVSPFCMKVETYLRMAKIPYAMQFIKDPRKAPKAKLPFIVDKEHTVADSSFILEYLQKAYDVTLDRDLNSHQQGIARMVTGALEERLYFVLLHNRWADDTNWPEIRQAWFTDLPPIVRSILPGVVRKGVLKALKGQGMALHSQTEIERIGLRDLQGLVDLIGDQKYLLGNQATSVDATVFSFLANILYVPFSGPLQDFVAEQHVLTDYCKRMGKNVYPENVLFQ